jgi:hypothetical protein
MRSMTISFIGDANQSGLSKQWGISRFFSFNITKKLRIPSLVGRGVKDTQFENQHLLYKLINTTKNNM